MSAFRRGFLLLALSVGACTPVAPVPTRPISAKPVIFAVAASLGRGVNFGNKLEAPREGQWGTAVRDADIDLVAQAGFRTIRLPVRFANHAETTPPFRLDPAILSRVDHIVDVATAHGLNILIDLHNHPQMFGDKLASNEEWVEPALLDDRFVALWRQIAEHFRSRPPTVLFELLNEPHKDMSADHWNRLAARALQAVRESNPDRAVIIGPTDWNNAKDLDKLDLPADPNLIVTIHNYEPFTFTHQGASWLSGAVPPLGVKCCDAAQIARLTAPLDQAAAWGKARNRPIYLGEFGAYDRADMASRAAFTRLMRDEAEKRGMSWSYWEFDSGFGAYDPKNGHWATPIKDALLGE